MLRKVGRLKAEREFFLRTKAKVQLTVGWGEYAKTPAPFVSRRDKDSVTSLGLIRSPFDLDFEVDFM